MLITAIREHAQYDENARDVSALFLDKRQKAVTRVDSFF
jgi:hypothetical protein